LHGFDVTAALFSGQGFSTVYIGTSMGFATLSNNYLAFSNHNLGLLNVTALGFDKNYGTIYANVSTGLFTMNLQSLTWSYLTRALCGVMPHSFAIDPTVPNSMFAATNFGVFSSSDNGTSWFQTGLSTGQYYAITISALNHKYMFAGGEKGLYISKDAGSNWSYLPGPFDLPIRSIVSTSNGSLFVLAKNSIYVSNDAGKNFTLVSNVSSLSPVTLAGDYNDLNVFYLGTTDGVFISRDSGANWEMFGDLPIGTVVYSIISTNDSNGTVYLGTNSGVYKSEAIQDNTPPIINISYPQNGNKLNSPSLTMAGSVFDNESGLSKVIINGLNVNVKSDGTFSFDMTLSPGANNIVIKAYDKANNVSTKTLTVYYAKTTILVLYIGSNRMTTSDGETITLDSPPVIVEGRTLVPIRPIVEKLGGTVGWDSIERKVTITLGDKTLELWIGKNTAKVNGTTVLIDSSNTKVVPQIISERTMLPVRFVAESLGAKVDWDGTAKKITITYPAP
jgi:hypothetical protein